MQTLSKSIGRLAQERIDEEIRQPPQRRRVAAAQPSSIRRAIGRRFIAVGTAPGG